MKSSADPRCDLSKASVLTCPHFDVWLKKKEKRYLMNWIRAQISMNSYIFVCKTEKKNSSRSRRSWKLFFLSYVLNTATLALVFLDLDIFCFCILLLKSHSAFPLGFFFPLCLGMETGKNDVTWSLTLKKKRKKWFWGWRDGFIGLYFTSRLSSAL